MNTTQEYRKAYEILKELAKERDDHRVAVSWCDGIAVFHFQSPVFARDFARMLVEADIENLFNSAPGGQSTVALQ